MPYISPSPGDVHVNRPLTNLLVGYMQDETNYVADRVFPNVPVSKQSDAYWEYDRADWNRDDMKDRAPGTESAGSAYGLETKVYYAKVKALHKDVPDQLLDNADSPLNLERDATLFVTRKALLHREVAFVARYFTDSAPGAIWTFVVDGVASGATAPGSFDPTNDSNNKVLHWNDAASTPIEDMRRGMTFVQQRTGFRPNKLTLGRPVWDVLQDHPDIVARIDSGQTPNGPAKASKENLATLLELDEVLVMEAIYNTAQNDGAAVNHQFIGGKHALLTYSPAQAGIMLPSAGYTFSWTGRFGNTDRGVRVKRFRIERLEVTRVEAQQAFDQKIIAPDLGYFFNGIVA